MIKNTPKSILLISNKTEKYKKISKIKYIAFYIQHIQLKILNSSYAYLLNLLSIISQINSIVKNNIFNNENTFKLISKVFYKNSNEIKTISYLNFVF